MNIAVAIKTVPHPLSPVDIDQRVKELKIDFMGSVLNPLDEKALEWALRLRDQAGQGKVALVSVSSPSLIGKLRVASSPGADEIRLLESDGRVWVDPHLKAKAIVKALSDHNWDVVLFGERSPDTGNHQLAARVAHLLGFPLIAQAVSMRVSESGDSIIVENLLDGNIETWLVTLPAVISVLRGERLRYPSLKRRKMAVRIPALSFSFPADERFGSELAEPNPSLRLIDVGHPKPRKSSFLKVTHELNPGRRLLSIMKGRGANEKVSANGVVRGQVSQLVDAAVSFLSGKGVLRTYEKEDRPGQGFVSTRGISIQRGIPSLSPGTIWFIAGCAGGDIDRGCLSSLSEAKILSGASGRGIIAILLGSKASVDSLLALKKKGISRVLVIFEEKIKSGDPVVYSLVLEGLYRLFRPSALLFSLTEFLALVASSFSAKTNLPLVSEASSLEKGPSGSQRFTRHILRRRASVLLECDSSSAWTATLNPRDFPKSYDHESEALNANEVPVESLVSSKVEGKSFIKSRTDTGEDQDIENADIVISGGRGMGFKENLRLLDLLAGALGGRVSCSRPVCDSGWMGKDRMVGMTGKSISPRLYIACGISGAAQHIDGVREAESIMSINKDEKAPITKVAELAIIGDALEVIPELIKKLGRAA